MDWPALPPLLNTASGLVLVALGIAAAFNPTRKRLVFPLFLMSWGAQVAFTNLATTSDSLETARLLHWIGVVLVPLPGLLLLIHAAQVASDDPASRLITRLGKACFLLAAVAVTIGALWILLDASSVMTVVEKDGAFARELGQPYYLLDGPKYLGVAIGLVLLAGHAVTTGKIRKEWLLLVGLCLAWAYGMGYTFDQELDQEAPQVPNVLLLSILAVAGACAAMVAPILLSRAAKTTEPRAPAFLPLLVLVAAAIAVVAEPKDAFFKVLVAPGLWRLAALALLLPALVSRRTFNEVFRGQANARLRVPLLATLLAVVIVAVANYTPPFATMTIYAIGLTLASIGIISLFSGWQIMRGVGAVLRHRPI